LQATPTMCKQAQHGDGELCVPCLSRNVVQRSWKRSLFAQNLCAIVRKSSHAIRIKLHTNVNTTTAATASDGGFNTTNNRPWLSHPAAKAVCTRSIRLVA
jgi:hypothetical protein